MTFLFDTSAVNRIRDGKAPVDAWYPARVTDLVLFELGRTPDADRRQSLLAVVQTRASVILRSEPLGTQDGEGQWGFGEPDHAPLPLAIGRPFPLILRALGVSHRQHWRDAFIVQAALINGLTLVTADRKQAKAARGFGVPVEYIE
jgi:predicted nucleic acid-binding protein